MLTAGSVETGAPPRLSLAAPPPAATAVAACSPHGVQPMLPPPRPTCRRRLHALEFSTSKVIRSVHTGGVACLDLDAVEQRYLLAGAGDASLAIYDTQAPSAADRQAEQEAAREAAGTAAALTSNARFLRPSGQAAAARARGGASEHAALAVVGRQTPGAHRYSVSAAAWYPVDSGLFVSGESLAAKRNCCSCSCCGAGAVHPAATAAAAPPSAGSAAHIRPPGRDPPAPVSARPTPVLAPQAALTARSRCGTPTACRSSAPLPWTPASTPPPCRRWPPATAWWPWAAATRRRARRCGRLLGRLGGTHAKRTVGSLQGRVPVLAGTGSTACRAPCFEQHPTSRTYPDPTASGPRSTLAGQALRHRLGRLHAHAQRAPRRGVGRSMVARQRVAAGHWRLRRPAAAVGRAARGTAARV